MKALALILQIFILISISGCDSKTSSESTLETVEAKPLAGNGPPSVPIELGEHTSKNNQSATDPISIFEPVWAYFQKATVLLEDGETLETMVQRYSNFILPSGDRVQQQVRTPEMRIYFSDLEPADTLNGIEGKGSVHVEFQVSRVNEPDEGWTDWSEGPRFSFQFEIRDGVITVEPGGGGLHGNPNWISPK